MLDEFVLFRQTFSLLATDLLLAELCLIVALLPDSVQVVLHHLLLSADLVHSLQLVLSEVLVANIDKLLLPLPASQQSYTILLCLLLALLLFSLLLQHFVVVLLLEFLQLSCLFACLLDLLDGSHLLVLEHPHTVPQLLDVPLQLQPDGPSLVVRQVLALDVDHNVWPERSTLRGSSQPARLALGERIH